jgi:hypothetical protein
MEKHEIVEDEYAFTKADNGIHYQTGTLFLLHQALFLWLTRSLPFNIHV